MIRFNNLTWATCPACKTELNNFKIYPMSVLQSESFLYHPIMCPICKSAFLVRLKIEATFESMPIKDHDQEKMKKLLSL